MRNKKIGLILKIFICGAILLWGLNYLDYFYAYTGDEVQFSHKQFFYQDDIKLRITGKIGSEIRYTVDGSKVTEESPLYEGSIKLEAAEEEVEVTTFRVMAFYKDGTASEEYVHTYFVGETVFEAYTELITVVSVNEEDLYDYETGIFVEGALRDEWREENPDSTEKVSRPANYNLRGIEAERDAYFEVFEPTGNRVIAQDVGIRVSGGITRGSDQKSIRIYAREEYGNDQLEYLFFQDAVDFEGNPITQVNRLTLRNNRNAKHAVMMEVLSEVEQLDVQEITPYVGYLNGEAYTVGWMMETYKQQYFRNTYGTTSEEGEWETFAGYNEEVIDGIEPEEITNFDPDITETEDLALIAQDDYFSFWGSDFTNDEVFAKFQELVDIESMMYYFAAEIYMANPDWPYNNVKLYRWYSYTEEYEEEGRKNGKWHFLLYDLDGGFETDPDNRLFFEVISEEYGLESGRYYAIFARLLEREDMQIAFRAAMEDLIETAFEPEKVCQQIDEISAYTDEATPEIIETMKTYAYGRAEVIREQMDEAFEMLNAKEGEE